MAEKKSFLLLSLNEVKLKKIADAIGSETAQKILDLIAEKGSVTETEISKALMIPLSTVHYNMKNLVESTLVAANEFHYSEKGKEVNHYSLANKYIIIAPKEAESGLRDRIKNLLFTAVTVLIVASSIPLFSILKGNFRRSSLNLMSAKTAAYSEAAADSSLPAPMAAGGESLGVSGIGSTQLFLIFIGGAALALAAYLIIEKIRGIRAERKP
ncbi:MAG: helix-turn-helix domain-containing protein [Candidatus Woesearchaeota archaeon]|nr:helix-turn-helix domain-containing protein [Candidatus Woesearchaeota archaeon]